MDQSIIDALRNLQSGIDAASRKRESDKVVETQATQAFVSALRDLDDHLFEWLQELATAFPGLSPFKDRVNTGMRLQPVTGVSLPTHGGGFSMYFFSEEGKVFIKTEGWPVKTPSRAELSSSYFNAVDIQKLVVDGLKSYYVAHSSYIDP